jgi:outer membrane protein OmpA-like peptidoglycan-associated protein
MKKLFIVQLVAVLLVSSCGIKTKEQYMKSKLSGIVTEDYSAYFDKQMDEELDLINKKTGKMQKEIDKLSACCQSPTSFKDSFAAINAKIAEIEKNAAASNATSEVGKLSIYYDLNLAVLTKFHEREIIRWYGNLAITGKLTATTMFMVSSYTDQIGGDEYNKKLSDKRSQAVVKYLTEVMNVPANRIKVMPPQAPMKLDNRIIERRSEIWIQ